MDNHFVPCISCIFAGEDGLCKNREAHLYDSCWNSELACSKGKAKVNETECLKCQYLPYRGTDIDSCGECR